MLFLMTILISQAFALDELSPTAKGLAFCQVFQECQKANPAGSTMCIRDALFKSKLTKKKIEASHAKEIGRDLRREGFQEPTTDLNGLPQGSILVLDAHDPIKDKKPYCPKVYGAVLVKCGGSWVDKDENALDFYIKRGCRTKGIWIHPAFITPNR